MEIKNTKEEDGIINNIHGTRNQRTMICKPIGQKRFQCLGILLWTIHDALGLTHFCGM
jgi:hypothetical protein